MMASVSASVCQLVYAGCVCEIMPHNTSECWSGKHYEIA
jgi:hypothetical protein